MADIKRAVIMTAVITTWVSLIAGGLKSLADYSNRPGLVGKVRSEWPTRTALVLKQDGEPTLVLFLHPKCPCSRATVGELDALMARTEGKAHVYAVFIQPKGWRDSEITEQSLWKRVSAIPGVTPFIDHDGLEARRFGALTSGHILGFDDRGELGFSGGITIARGHRGDNPGLQSAIEFVRAGRAPAKESRVFGCELFAGIMASR